MLILSRKINEKVHIVMDGKTITVTLVMMQRSQVRLGFDGPPEAVFLRDEIVQREKANADTNA